jgi:hypothetical protein
MTTTERQARFRDKMRGAGYSRISEWVPKHSAPEFRQVAKALREKHDKLPGALKIT